MSLSDLLHYAISSLMHRQLRSWLTILSIVIGIAAIVSLVAIGQGVDAYIRGQISQLGSDYIDIVPGSLEDSLSGGGMLSAQKDVLTKNDVDAIKSTPGISEVYPQVNGRVILEFKGENATGICIGIDGGAFDSMGSYFKIGKGRFYRNDERRAVVIGKSMAEDVFDDEIKSGDTVRINGVAFKVIGISEPLEISFGSSFSNIMYMPLEDMVEISNSSRTKITYPEIFATTIPGSDANLIAKDVEVKLRNLHKVTEDTQDFTVMTPDYMMDLLGGITSTLNLFLAGLASIAVIVGGVGIANTMFASVLERTREIGVLKAIGARSTDIQIMFLLESGIMGITGGMVGVVMGYAACCVMQQFGVPTIITRELIIFSLLFSLGVGIVSGWIPARQASQLEPVEALRYE